MPRLADEWIHMRTNLAGRPQVAWLSAHLPRRIDRDVRTIIGMLHTFWSWAREATADGNLPGVTPDFVNGLVRAPQFAETLAAYPGTEPWLIVSADGITIPDWDVWLSGGSMARREEARRKRELRTKAGQKPDKCPKIPDENRSALAQDLDLDLDSSLREEDIPPNPLSQAKGGTSRKRKTRKEREAEQNDREVAEVTARLRAEGVIE